MTRGALNVALNGNKGFPPTGKLQALVTCTIIPLSRRKPFRCQCDHAHRWVHWQPQWLVTATDLERMSHFTAVARLTPPIVSVSSLNSDPSFSRRRSNQRQSISSFRGCTDFVSSSHVVCDRRLWSPQ